MTKQGLAEEQQALLAGYVLYNLSPEEAALVEQWIADDPAIAAELEQLQQTVEAAYGPEAVTPPASLRESTLRAYDAQLAETSVQRTPAQNIPARALARPAPAAPLGSRWVKGLGAVAALLIVGLGLGNYALWRSLQQAQQGQLQGTALTVSLTPPEDAPAQGSATVALSPQALRASLTAQLPPLPEDRVYVLWTVLLPNAPFTTDDKAAILTHTFTGAAEEPVVLPSVYQDIRWVKGLAITIENADAPQRHSAAPILFGQL